VQHTVTHKSK